MKIHINPTLRTILILADKEEFDDLFEKAVNLNIPMEDYITTLLKEEK